MKVHSGVIRKPRRAMLYGTAGIGKSTWASHAEDPVFVSTEEGANDLNIQRFLFGQEERPVALTYAEVIDALSQLYTEEHAFRTIVIDSLDWLEKLIWASVCARQNPPKQNIEDIGYAKGYKFALTEWREFLGWCDALRDQRGMTVLLLAHAKVDDFEAPGNPKYDRYMPALHDLATATICEWCDEVLFANYEVSTAVKDDSFNKKTYEGIGKGIRAVFTTERPSHIAKNRLGMPDTVGLIYGEYAAYARGEVPAEPAAT